MLTGRLTVLLPNPSRRCDMDATFLKVLAISGLCYNLCVLRDAYKRRIPLDNDTTPPVEEGV